MAPSTVGSDGTLARSAMLTSEPTTASLLQLADRQ
jgi:hypothetical protein